MLRLATHLCAVYIGYAIGTLLADREWERMMVAESRGLKASRPKSIVDQAEEALNRI